MEVCLSSPPYTQATPVKCLDLDDITGHLKLYNVVFVYAFFNEEAPFYKQFGRGVTILSSKFGRGLVKFYLFMSKTMLEVGWKFILWSMFYLEGWSSRSSYFIGEA